MVQEKVDRYRGLGAREGSAKGEQNVSGRIEAMRSLRPLAGARLLDIGCGNGAYTLRMAPTFDEVVGIDLEPDRIGDFRAVVQGSAGDRSRIRVLLGSAAELPYPDGHFDVVTAIETMEHLGGATDAVLTELARVLAPGGTFYLTTPNRWWPLEQHGFLAPGGGRRPGWQFPFLTWVPAVHRRFSDADAFTPVRLDRIVEPYGFGRTGLTYMWPPLDGHRRLQQLTAAPFALASRSPARRFAQTLVMTYRRIGAAGSSRGQAGRAAGQADAG